MRMDRWNAYEKVEATIVSGGGFFALKGVLQDADPGRMTVCTKNARLFCPYGAPDQPTIFTPDRIAIEKLNGTLVAERRALKDSFAGHQMNTPWDPLHRAYFNGEALWTESWREGTETWRVHQRGPVRVGDPIQCELKACVAPCKLSERPLTLRLLGYLSDRAVTVALP
jgi:hypothetical protein